MLIKNMTNIWCTDKITRMEYGQPQNTYTNLRNYLVNVQYMSNDEEQRNYGTITNTAIVIRSNISIDIKIGDNIYFDNPFPDNQGALGAGEFEVDAVKLGAFGIVNKLNPMVITARKVVL